jgi:hypothetical protein
MDEPLHSPWWRSASGLALCGFLLIAGFFLITEHTAHVLGVLPFLLFLLCPLLHLFHHGRHGGHGGHGHHHNERRDDAKPPPGPGAQP